MHLTHSYHNFDNFSGWVRNVQGTGSIVVGTGTATIKSNEINKVSYMYRNYYVPAGGFIEISCEAKNVSGSGGRIAILASATENIVGTVVDDITVNHFDYMPRRLRIPGTTSKPWVTVLLGFYSTTVGEAIFRNVNVRVFDGHLAVPEVRACMIKGTTDGWEIDDGLDRYTNINVRSVYESGNELIVEFEPFRTWQRPICMAQITSVNGRHGFTAHVDAGSKDMARITIADRDGNVEDPSTFKGTANVYITFRAEAAF